MEIISQWVKNIIFLILVTTFLIIFLPDSSIRKYVKVVMGFFIISIFISPFSTFFNQDLESISNSIFQEKTIKRNWEEIKSEGELIKNTNQDFVEENYLNNIESEIKKYLNFEFPHIGKNVTVNITENYKIKSVTIQYINKNIKKVKIEPVDIGVKEEKEKKSESTVNKKKLKFITKNKISNIFQIPEDVIKVKILNRGDIDGNN